MHVRTAGSLIPIVVAAGCSHRAQRVLPPYQNLSRLQTLLVTTPSVYCNLAGTVIYLSAVKRKCHIHICHRLSKSLIFGSNLDLRFFFTIQLKILAPKLAPAMEAEDWTRSLRT